VLKETSNAIGKFLFVDPKLLSGSERRMGKMLVEVDMHEGLLAKLEIEWCGTVVQQCLDFMGVLFRSTLCKQTGHFQNQCWGQSKKAA